MIAAKLMGGLGNMMFQIATTYSLSLDNDDECAFSLADGNFMKSVVDRFGDYEDAHCYEENIFRRINILERCPPITYREPSFEYRGIPYHPHMCLQGYFQSEKYFVHNREKILDLFELSVPIKYEGLFVHDVPLVSVHVRRGDYLKFSKFHPPCSMDYYEAALRNLDMPKATLVVFSDDIEWCKNNFSTTCIFVEGNSDVEDLSLMSKCDHHIIANSSFSWWGAWMNSHPEKEVIAPLRWFGANGPSKITKDLYCDGWIIK